MKRINTTKTILAAAALTGTVTGSFTARTQAATSNANRQIASDAGQIADEKEKGETHDCAGKNSCKGKGGCGMKDGKPNPPKK